ncbi:hypothetical protein EPO05_03115 [Patescibacteria group bacterium]|nr:MAG: hypothetical protein EPO05_03115 [Patescibacteria group bacterium]
MQKSLAIITGSLGVLSLFLFANVQTADAFWVVAPPKPPKTVWVAPPRAPRPIVHPYAVRQHERREAIWENCDYDAWKARVGDRPITEDINSGNFDEFCEMHALANDAKYVQANEIRKDLDLPFPPRARHPFYPPHPRWR